MDKLDKFSVIFTKGNNFHYFMSAFLYTGAVYFKRKKLLLSRPQSTKKDLKIFDIIASLAGCFQSLYINFSATFYSQDNNIVNVVFEIFKAQIMTFLMLPFQGIFISV